MSDKNASAREVATPITEKKKKKKKKAEEEE